MGDLIIQPNVYQVEDARPLDDRHVVADVATRDALVWKYEGMPVYVEDVNITYVLTALPNTWSALGGGSGHVIQDNGTPVTQRANLNFIGTPGTAVTVADNAGNDSTDITVDVTVIDGGSS